MSGRLRVVHRFTDHSLGTRSGPAPPAIMIDTRICRRRRFAQKAPESLLRQDRWSSREPGGGGLGETEHGRCWHLACSGRYWTRPRRGMYHPIPLLPLNTYLLGLKLAPRRAQGREKSAMQLGGGRWKTSLLSCALRCSLRTCSSAFLRVVSGDDPSTAACLFPPLSKTRAREAPGRQAYCHQDSQVHGRHSRRGKKSGPVGKGCLEKGVKKRASKIT